MGEVDRARDIKLKRDVAIKVMLPKVANDPDRLARFGRDAQVLASLTRGFGIADPASPPSGATRGRSRCFLSHYTYAIDPWHPARPV